MPSSSKKIRFDVAEFARECGYEFSPHDNSMYWDDFPGCCTASVLMDLPSKERVEEAFEDYKQQRAEDELPPFERITINQVFLEVWKYVYARHPPGNSLGIMTLVQYQHTPAVRAFLRSEGWKKCGERRATTGNTVSLWARF